MIAPVTLLALYGNRSNKEKSPPSSEPLVDHRGVALPRSDPEPHDHFLNEISHRQQYDSEST